MLPFSSALQLGRSLVLELPQPVDGFSIDLRWDPYFDLNLEHHRGVSPTTGL
jgi:hypothetical protein